MRPSASLMASRVAWVSMAPERPPELKTTSTSDGGSST